MERNNIQSLHQYHSCHSGGRVRRAVGIGTVIITIFSGYIIHLFMKIIDQFDQRTFQAAPLRES